MRGNPERFVTFVLGSFVFVFYFISGYQMARGRRPGEDLPKQASQMPFSEQALKFLTHAATPLLTLVWAYYPRWFHGVPRALALENWPIRILGLFFLCAATAVMWTTCIELGSSRKLDIDSESPAPFIQAGIYSSIRHPVYSAYWLWNLGVFLLAPNLMFVLLWALTSSAIARQAHHEERSLEMKFGKSYRDYSNRTGRFFPLWL